MNPPISLRMSSRVRARALGALVLLALIACGCGGSASVDVYLAEYAPFGSSGVSTDLIFPRESGSSRFLVRNWPPMTTLQGNTVWVHGKWAHVGFYSVADDPPTFVAEARPFAPEGAPTQVLTVLLNDTRIESVPMRPGWRTYEIELPAGLLEVGWNVVELDFAHTLRPSDFDPDSNDGRTLAAQFRHIEVRAAAGRTHWPERPEAVGVSGLHSDGAPTIAPAAETAGDAPVAKDAMTAGAEDPAEATIEMPADSFLEVFVHPEAGSELMGTVQAEFESAEDGYIRVVIDAIEPDTSSEIWSGELRPGFSATTVNADLSAWAGRIIGMRLRVFGSLNGSVRWNELRITASSMPGDVLARPDRIIDPPSSGALGRPDVFLVILDAARADVFEGALGAELAPNVLALAAEGTRFSQAWAPSSWTGQTIPALWSGLSPDTVGIDHWGSRLPPEITTFPEVVYDAGYHTVLWSQHNIYRARAPLRHGFEVFEEVDSTDLAQREILPSVADLVDDERPTLAVIHLLPPHEPYLPPQPFRGTRSSWYEGEHVINARLLDQFDRVFPEDQAALRDEIRRAAIAMYQENVQFADHLVGRLVDDLRRQGRYEDALIIVTADHGEAFYEHGRFLHTQLLFEEFVRVPLVVKWPRSFQGFAPRVDAPVSLLDLAPTLIDGIGIEDRRARYQGRTLLPVVGGAAPPSRIVYAYTSGETNPGEDSKRQYALRWNDLKLIHDERYGRTLLYRLSEDPGETEDLSQEAEFYTGWLLQTMRLAQAHNAGFLVRAGGAQVEDLDEETIRSLRALGYLR